MTEAMGEGLRPGRLEGPQKVSGAARIAADALGLPLERVRLELGDTGTGPRSPTSSGSSTLPTMGPAAPTCCREERRRENTLRDNELLVQVEIPARSPQLNLPR